MACASVTTNLIAADNVLVSVFRIYFFLSAFEVRCVYRQVGTAFLKR